MWKKECSKHFLKAVIALVDVSFPACYRHTINFLCLKDFKLKENILAVINGSTVKIWDILSGKILKTLSG